MSIGSVHRKCSFSLEAVFIRGERPGVGSSLQCLRLRFLRVFICRVADPRVYNMPLAQGPGEPAGSGGSARSKGTGSLRGMWIDTLWSRFGGRICRLSHNSAG